MAERQVAVVGGGLAGAVVASTLHARGWDVQWVLGRSQVGTASQAAAGLVNVVTGVRPAVTWQAPQLVQAFRAWLALPSVAVAAEPCWHPMPVYRRLATLALFNDWCGVVARLAVPGVTLTPTAEPWRPALLGPHPAGLQQTGLGWMDVPGLLQHLPPVLASRGVALVPAAVEWPASDLRRGHLVLDTGDALTADAVISVEGIAVNANPFRPFRPLAPLKGQLLTVHLDPDPALDCILTGGHYLLPIGAGCYHVGSTYESQFADNGPTAEGSMELLRGIRDHLPGWTGQIQVLEHRAGIRATTPDRRAVLRQHPVHPRLWFLNGLGTKGLLQAPRAAQLLADSLAAGQPVWEPAWDGARKALRLEAGA